MMYDSYNKRMHKYDSSEKPPILPNLFSPTVKGIKPVPHHQPNINTRITSAGLHRPRIGGRTLRDPNALQTASTKAQTKINSGRNPALTTELRSRAAAFDDENITSVLCRRIQGLLSGPNESIKSTDYESDDDSPPNSVNPDYTRVPESSRKSIKSSKDSPSSSTSSAYSSGSSQSSRKESRTSSVRSTPRPLLPSTVTQITTAKSATSSQIHAAQTRNTSTPSDNANDYDFPLPYFDEEEAEMLACLKDGCDEVHEQKMTHVLDLHRHAFDDDSSQDEDYDLPPVEWRLSADKHMHTLNLNESQQTITSPSRQLWSDALASPNKESMLTPSMDLIFDPDFNCYYHPTTREYYSVKSST